MPKSNAPAPVAGKDVMEAFAEEAPNLDLHLEDPELLIGQPVGALVSCIVGSPLVQVKPPRHPPETPSHDAVREKIRLWETFDPDNLLATWDEHAVQPNSMVLTSEWIGAVDRKMIEEGILTPEYRKQRKKYPSFSPRKVNIDNLQIVFIGSTQAVATYRFEEEFRNGKVVATNAVAILMLNGQKEWKIGLYSKHL